MKNDHFYEDDERFYNLNYTHDQLRDLLNKINEGCILTKEQYTQLIEEIGLDNISTFDLNYYHLKNLPIIPVRVSELFNDVGYDVRKRVDAELETIYGLIEDDVEQLNDLKKYLEDINMAETLNSINKANDRVEYLNDIVTGINGVVFSFERSIDLIKDKASELSTEFEILKHRQDSNEGLMDQANNKTLVNANDIIKLTDLYHTLDERHNKIDDQFKKVTDDVIERDEAIYVLISSLNSEMEAMEDLLKIFNPDDVDKEFLINVTESINNLKNEIISINENLELKQQQINAIEVLISDYKTIINNTVVTLQEADANLQANINTVNESLNSKIDAVMASLTNVEKEVDINAESIIDIYDKYDKTEEAITNITTDIQNLDNKNKELEQSIDTFNELNDNINEVSNKIEANSQDIELNKLSIVNLEKTNVDIIEDLNEIRNDISENINNINLTNEEITKTNNALNDTNAELNNTKKRVTKTEADVESLTLNLEAHHAANAERIKEVDEAVEDLSSRIGSCDANILTFEARIANVEENITTLATKDALNNIENGIEDLDGRLEELEGKEVEVDLSSYQEKTDNDLATESKDIVGAINELFQSANNGKQLIANAIGEPLSSNDTFSAMSDKINDMKSDLKQVLTDEGVDVTEEDDIASLIGKVDQEFTKDNNTINNLNTEKTNLTNQINSLNSNIENTRNTLAGLMQEGGYDITGNESIDSLLNLLAISGISVGDIKQIACGYNYTVILKNDGSLWSCGYNISGQLGLGNNTRKTSFTKVTTNINNDVKQVACGSSHTVILKNDGSIWSCGGNGNGQLGLGNRDTNVHNTFTKITTNINNDVKQIACGEYHTFIFKNDGSVWCCGSNVNGQLGLGNTTNENTFTKVTTNISNDVKQIVCGGQHTFILKTNGSVWSCGDNSKGQLGLNDTTDRTTFTQVTTNINNDVKQIACGGLHTLILKTDDNVWSCGYNFHGALGLNDSTQRTIFTQVTTNINKDVKQIVCGEDCSLILKNDGSVYACGDNGYGQLGLGYATGKTSFTKVTTNIKQIACGGHHTFILKNDRSLHSCGENDSGQLGLGDDIDKTSFTQVQRGL